MPYTECFMMEVLRYGTAAPLGLWHKATEDAVFEGYKIPKDTIIFANAYEAMHSSEIWGDPETIRPERFLLPDGRVDRKNEAWIAFSAGKRECPGEALARTQVFMFITGLCQHFRFKMDPTAEKPKLTSLNVGIICTPHPHKLLIEERKEK